MSSNTFLKAVTATLISWSFFALTSCETITVMELPREEPQLVVNAVFNVDSLVKVDLSESKPVNGSSNSFTAVENASIEVFKNSASLGFLKYKGKGQYFSETSLPNVPGAEYSLKVRASGFDDAEAAEILPAVPVIGDLRLIPGSQNNSTYKSYTGTFTLNDAPEDNFYFLRVWQIDKNNFKSLVYASLKNNLGQFEHNGMMSGGAYLFDDKSFNGKSIALEFDLIQGFYTNDEGKYKLMFELLNTGKAYFNYQYDVRKKSGGSSIFNPEKSPVSNNIKSGLGIFAPYNSATLIYDVN